MGRRRGFIGILNAMAQSSARAQRQAGVQLRRAERERARIERHTLRMQKISDAESRKEAKQRERDEHLQYIESRIEESDELNESLKEQLDDLSNILNHTLHLDDTVTFESLLPIEKFREFVIPPELMVEPPVELTASIPMPSKPSFFAEIKPLNFLSRLSSKAKDKHARATNIAETAYNSALRNRDRRDATRIEKLELFNKERKDKINKMMGEHEKEKLVFDRQMQLKREKVEQFQKAYIEGDPEAVIAYCSMVLERSEYPDEFPQKFRVAYVPDPKELVIEYELPPVDIIPAIAEHKYTKAKDTIDYKARKEAEIRNLYRDAITAVTLRTIHEVLEADQLNHIEVVVLNGFVNTIDRALGKKISPCIISVRTTKEAFNKIDLSLIDKTACLRNLGAQVSQQPSELIAVKPIIEFDMVDRRFVDEGNVLNDLDGRSNLMDLNPFEFETLVCNLFGKMGLESKLTRSSKDGGVDAVAYDARPILGGKVVIQSKRYKNTVGVSAVRDLYGTMQHEGANKGILVTTSSYGQDAYEFSKDKPIELIDGGGLLYLLDQIGVKTRIIFPEE